MLKKNINLEIGERVRIIRISRGFSREELSEILNISTLFLGYIECGQRGMSLSTLQNMCKALNVSADYLLLGKTDEETTDMTIINAVKELDSEYYPIALEMINNLKKIITLSKKKTENQEKK